MLTCMEMKPNAFRRSCRGFNHPQIDRVACPAGETDHSRLIAKYRSLESVGAVQTRLPVVLRRWEFVPILVIGNELFQAVGKFETSLSDTRGDLNRSNADCHYGVGRKICGVPALQKKVYIFLGYIGPYGWILMGFGVSSRPVRDHAPTHPHPSTQAFRKSLLSCGTTTELVSMFTRRCRRH